MRTDSKYAAEVFCSDPLQAGAKSIYKVEAITFIDGNIYVEELEKWETARHYIKRKGIDGSGPVWVIERVRAYDGKWYKTRENLKTV